MGCAPGQTLQYANGFADLARLAGGWMGEPITCEYPDPKQTGDVHQGTTRGLAYWRESTNTAAFTNGSEHWALLDGTLVYWTGAAIDPPAGELVAAQINPRPTPSPSPSPRDPCMILATSTFLPQSALPAEYPDDAAIITGTARNGCDRAARSWARLENLQRTDNGPINPAHEAVWLGVVPAKQTVEFQIPVARLPDGMYRWNVRFEEGTGDRPGAGLPCPPILDRGRCVPADARLESALRELARVEVGRDLLRRAVEAGVELRVADLPPTTHGQYQARTRTAAVDDRLLAYTPKARAAVLAHELQHAVDHAGGKLGTGVACYGNEEDAFHKEADVWLGLNNGRLSDSDISLERELNYIAYLARRDPYRLIKELSPSYEHQCERSG